MKKHHLVVGTIIGGILLAATMQSASTFALSDTSSTTDPTTSDTPTTSSDPAATPPVDGSVAGGSTATQTDTNSAAVSTTNDAAASDNSTPPPSDPVADPTNTNSPAAGPSSDPTNNPSNTDTTSGNNTTIGNTINGTSQSGNATVSNNGRGGDATTGDASGITTLINAIASASDLSGGLQTFTMNLNGTQNGNVLLDPNALLTLAGAGNNKSGGSYNSDLTNNSTINNNVDLSATSGNANVTDNRHGGNATSGDATTEADIVNLIESLISDQKAFLGVININGTLNGNIMLPASVIDQLLKNNGAGTDPNSNVVATNNMAVNNNVTLSAQTGDASVTNNGHAGDAISGNASTKLNIYNLINSQIVGGNVLLVFVNVMGNWYGVLMNAPAGTTSAALGGGITQSNMGDGDTSVPADQVFATNNETINNNVTLTSKSGDATVSGNHRGGNATTGNATAVADIVNILGSQINLSGWLGILVINVFGTWNGSLQVQPASTTSTGGTHHHGGSNHHGSSHNGSGYAYYINYAGSYGPAVTATSAQVLSDHTANHDFASDDQPVAVVFDHTKSNSKVMTDAIIAGLAATLAAGAGAARYFSTHRKKGE